MLLKNKKTLKHTGYVFKMQAVTLYLFVVFSVNNTRIREKAYFEKKTKTEKES